MEGLTLGQVVPTLAFPAPPIGKVYSAYRTWLERILRESTCAYCLLRERGLDIEHYEPKSMSPDLEHDPRNLLLACSGCNGTSGKWDYHPAHAKRIRLREDKTGYLVIDPRVDDYAIMFEVQASGELKARPGPTRARATWNIALLGLDKWAAHRKDLMDLLAACEELSRAPTTDAVAAKALSNILPHLCKSLVFFEVYGVTVPDALLRLLRSNRTSMQAEEA